MSIEVGLQNEHTKNIFVLKIRNKYEFLVRRILPAKRRDGSTKSVDYEVFTDIVNMYFVNQNQR